MSAFLLSILFLLSIVKAEKYAIIYGSVEYLTNTELPSSACRFYDYLESQNFKKSNIVYMLDTTDYNMDYTDTYTKWFDGNNYYLRDDVFKFSCSKIDFEGEYVTPKFLLYYLIGDEKHIKKLSGQSEPKMIHPTMDDEIVVYFSDTHGRGSEYYMDRVVDPDLVKKAVLIMKKNKLFRSLLFLAEAGYGDYAFHKLDRMKNVVALTIKDPGESGRFTHVYATEEEDEMGFVESVWDINWPSLLALSCGKTVNYLYQIATSAILQIPDQLLIPGIWGDREVMKKPLADFISQKDDCMRFFAFKEGQVKRDEVKDILGISFLKNTNTTIFMQQTRQLHHDYSAYLEKAVKTVYQTEVEENADFPISMDGCVSYLIYNLRTSCDYYMPLYDSIIQIFTEMCERRKGEGILMVNFKPLCEKNDPAKNLW